jgi:opacity protein-like surface antigen
MRSLLMAGMLLFAVAGSARAQDNPKGEIAGNYTYIHINPGGFSTVTIDCHGGGGSTAWSLNHYLGVVGEFSGCKWSGANAHTFTYLFGPRLTYRAYGRLEPFGEVLLGGAHIHGETIGFSIGSDNGFAMAIGGGADYKLKPSLAIRFIQADYLYTRLRGTNQNNFRLQVGVAFRFGGR